MLLHHLNCGTMRPFGGRLVDGETGYLRRATMVCHCLLVETGDGLVLIDSGLGVDDVTNPTASLTKQFLRATHPVLQTAETAVRQVVRLGYRPEDVRHIVLTHLDLDHAGGLRDFPHAKVHVYGEELRNASARATGRERARYRPAQWSHGPDWQTYDTAGDDWFGFDAVRELKGLPADILLVPLGGHTRGHAGVAVRTDDTWLLHCGDAYFFHGETRSAADCPPGLRLFQGFVETDRATRLSNQDRLRTLVAEHGDKVATISAHDPVELRRTRPHSQRDGLADRNPPQQVGAGEHGLDRGAALPALVIHRYDRIGLKQPTQLDRLGRGQRVPQRPRHREADAAEMQHGQVDLRPPRDLADTVVQHGVAGDPQRAVLLPPPTATRSR